MGPRLRSYGRCRAKVIINRGTLWPCCLRKWVDLVVRRNLREGTSPAAQAESIIKARLCSESAICMAHFVLLRPGATKLSPTGMRAGRPVLQDRTRPYLAVDADPNQGIVTITLRGELDSTARAALSEHLTEHLAEYCAQLAGTQPRQLVFDMAEVDFLDWAAAAVIFTATRLLLPAGVKPVMRSPRRPVRRLLEITGLDEQCELDPDDRSATRRVIIPPPRTASRLRADYSGKLRRSSLLFFCGPCGVSVIGEAGHDHSAALPRDGQCRAPAGRAPSRRRRGSAPRRRRPRKRSRR